MIETPLLPERRLDPEQLGRIAKLAPTLAKLYASAVTGTYGAARPFTTLENIGLMGAMGEAPAFIRRGASAVFGAQAAVQVPAQVAEGLKKLREEGWTAMPEAVIPAVVSAAIAVGAGRHALQREPTLETAGGPRITPIPRISDKVITGPAAVEVTARPQPETVAPPPAAAEAMAGTPAAGVKPFGQNIGELIAQHVQDTVAKATGKAEPPVVPAPTTESGSTSAPGAQPPEGVELTRPTPTPDKQTRQAVASPSATPVIETGSPVQDLGRKKSAERETSADREGIAAEALSGLKEADAAMGPLLDKIEALQGEHQRLERQRQQLIKQSRAVKGMSMSQVKAHQARVHEQIDTVESRQGEVSQQVSSLMETADETSSKAFAAHRQFFDTVTEEVRSKLPQTVSVPPEEPGTPVQHLADSQVPAPAETPAEVLARKQSLLAEKPQTESATEEQAPAEAARQANKEKVQWISWDEFAKQREVSESRQRSELETEATRRWIKGHKPGETVQDIVKQLQSDERRITAAAEVQAGPTTEQEAGQPGPSSEEAAKQIEAEENQIEAAARANYGAGNKVFTAERKRAAFGRLKERLGTTAAGVDPGYIRDLVEIGGYHVEAGIRNFAVWSRAMLEELGESVRPHLQAAWDALRKLPEYRRVTQLDPAAAEAEAAAEGITGFTGAKRATKGKAEVPPDFHKAWTAAHDVLDEVARLRQQLEPAEIKRRVAEAKAAGSARAEKRGSITERDEISRVFNEHRTVTDDLKKQLIGYLENRLGKNAGRYVRSVVDALREPNPAVQYGIKREIDMVDSRYRRVDGIIAKAEAFAQTLDRQSVNERIKTVAQAANKSKLTDVGVKPELRKALNMDRRALSLAALQTLADRVEELSNLGRATTSARLDILARERDKVLTQLGTEPGARKLEEHPQIIAQPGETLDRWEKLHNLIVRTQNVGQKFNWAYPPINAVLDSMSGGDYKTGLVKWIKGPIDLATEEYFKRDNRTARPVLDLWEKLKLTDASRTRIGAFAELAQQGGEDNLLAIGVAPGILNELRTKGLTAPEMEWYRAARRAMDEQFPDVQRLQRELRNEEVFKVSDYWPRQTDYAMTEQLPVGERLTRQGYWRTTRTQQRFTKERTGQGGGMAVKLDAFETFRRHMDDVSYYLEMQRDLDNLGRVVRNDKFRNVYGDLGQRVVYEWLDTVARKGGVDGAKRIRAVDTLSRNLSRGLTSYRVFSQLKHLSNAPIAAAQIGPVWYARGIRALGDDRWMQWVHENTPSVFERGGPDPAYQQTTRRPSEYYVARMSDQSNTIAALIGSYQKMLDSKGVRIPESGVIPVDKEALATALVMSHNATASVFAKDLPLMRSRGAFSGNVSVDRALTTFQSYLMERYGYFKHDIIDMGIREKDPVRATKAAAALLMASAIEIGIVAAGAGATKSVAKTLTGGGAGRPPKKADEGIAEKLVIESLRGSVPFAGNLITAYKYGESGVPMLDFIGDTARRAKEARQFKTAQSKGRAGVQLATDIASAAGVPGAGQIGQIVAAAIPKSAAQQRQEYMKSLLDTYRQEPKAGKVLLQQAYRAGRISQDEITRISKEGSQTESAVKIEHMAPVKLWEKYQGGSAAEQQEIRAAVAPKGFVDAVDRTVSPHKAMLLFRMADDRAKWRVMLEVRTKVRESKQLTGEARAQYLAELTAEQGRLRQEATARLQEQRLAPVGATP